MTGCVGVILAAGRGSRMGAVGEDYPKALLPVANEPLIGHHLRLLRGLGVQEVYVVVGHRATDVVSALGAGEAYGVRLHYVEQGAPLGSAHALGRVRPHVRAPFLLILGDYFFSVSDPARLARCLLDGRGSAIAAKREPDRRLLSEACELQVDTRGRLLGIVEKPASPVGTLKGCGFYALRPDFFDAIARTPRTALRDEYELTLALQLYVEAGHPVYAEEIVEWDRNFTRPEDILECNIQWLEQAGRNELVAEEAYIEQGIQLERTVVGRYARVTRGSRLEEVVVFAGARFEHGSSIRRALVTREGLYAVGQKHSALCAPASLERTPAGKEKI